MRRRRAGAVPVQPHGTLGNKKSDGLPDGRFLRIRARFETAAVSRSQQAGKLACVARFGVHVASATLPAPSIAMRSEDLGRRSPIRLRVACDLHVALVRVCPCNISSIGYQESG